MTASNMEEHLAFVCNDLDWYKTAKKCQESMVEMVVGCLALFLHFFGTLAI